MTGIAAHCLPVDDGIHLLRIQHTLLRGTAVPFVILTVNMVLKDYVFHNASVFSRACRPVFGVAEAGRMRIGCGEACKMTGRSTEMRSPIVLTVLLGLTGAAPALAEGPKIALAGRNRGLMLFSAPRCATGLCSPPTSSALSLR